MDQPISFAKPFAELVRLLAERSDVAPQKAALKSALMPLRRGTVTIASNGDALVVAGVTLPADEVMSALARRITARGVSTIVFEADAAPADVLAAARWLTDEPAAGDAGPIAIASLRTVRVAMRAQSDAADGRPRRPSRAVSTVEPATSPGRRRSTRMQAIVDEGAARRKSAAISAIPSIPGPPDAAIALHALDAAATPAARASALADIAEAIGSAIRAGNRELLADLGEGLAAHTAPGAPDRDAIIGLLARLAEPPVVRLLAQTAVTSPERADGVGRVLAHTGEAGAAIVIALVLQAKTLVERHTHFQTLIKMPAATAVLSRMLEDKRWYVARNAADLLGELHAREAETVLTTALNHTDERVRRSAANALAKLGTPGALQSLGAAMHDPSPLVRMQVASGLGGRKGTRSATTLSRALDEESDAEVQLAILAALGRVATPDAVNRLIKAAESEGRLFKKKPLAVRVAAVHALGEARTPAALAMLQSLANDKEREVREAVLRVAVQAQRGEPVDLS